MDRPQNTVRKLQRLITALHHKEPDRVPISDFFWGGFIKRWQQELGLSPDTDPYHYYDLDFVVTVPNMDPWIKAFEVLHEDETQVVVKTGFGATIRKHFQFPMPEMIAWEINSIDMLERAEFDDPADRRRFFSGGDNQIAGIGDGFQRNSPPWIETVKSLWPKFPVFGSIIEVSECLTRLVGQHNALLWIGEYPARMGKIINRIGEFYFQMAQAEMVAGAGWLDGFVIWGDVAYRRTTFFSPDYWREYFKPWVAKITQAAHAHGLPVIYHGCGNVGPLIEDFIEIGIDALNPLEAKAGLDVIELRHRFGHRIAFCGNSDITVWETNDLGKIRVEVLRKLNAARGGGYVFMSDHSVTSAVAGPTYDYIVSLVRQYGKYPLNLGEFNLDSE
jgi:hypothetical protein